MVYLKAVRSCVRHRHRGNTDRTQSIHNVSTNWAVFIFAEREQSESATVIYLYNLTNVTLLCLQLRKTNLNLFNYKCVWWP